MQRLSRHKVAMKLLNYYPQWQTTAHLGTIVAEKILDLTKAFPADSRFSSVSALLRAGRDSMLRAQRHVNEDASWIKTGPMIDEIRYGPPVDERCRIFCVGLNYADHAAENKLPPPESPIFFSKLASVAIGNKEQIPLPVISQQVDYEAEFAFVIGSRTKRVSVEDAWRHIAGFTIMNDVSARDLQFQDKQWFRGKNCDGFAPLGPWLVTTDEVSNPDNLAITLRLNGEVRQSSNTGQLFFKPAQLLSFLSQTLTLEAGDVISTGTPGGIGYYADPKVFLKDGDVVEVEVDGLGVLRNTVIQETDLEPFSSEDSSR
jgi:2-keto-4-pentenoate hydratase/2-oxohepta-3-ene-1,7-dioic acid hydratase in catechol pathway